MANFFDGFDLTTFWSDTPYAREAYQDVPVTDELVAEIEAELGYKLPASYVALMRTRNGGCPRNTCIPTVTETSWAEDHVAISGISGIGRTARYSLCGAIGSRFMQNEWGYPDIGICIADCPSAGHDMIMLDYRACGPEGEPQVVHVDQESDYHITFLAKDFESFIRALVDEEEFSEAEAMLEDARITVAKGAFSPLLAELVASPERAAWKPWLRDLCSDIVEAKGHFSLHADETSWLVYDVLFQLYSSARLVRSREHYLEVYPHMLVMGQGFSTGGYAPGFVEAWFDARAAAGDIVSSEGGLRFHERVVERLDAVLSDFATAGPG